MVRVLIPVDFSSGSKCSIEKGFKILPHVNEAFFVYVVPLGMKELEDFVEPNSLELAKRKAEEKMKSFVESLNIDADKISYAIADGDPASVLIDLANSGKFDVVLIAHKGHSYIVDFLIGSTTLKLIAKCKIPVIVVRKEKEDSCP